MGLFNKEYISRQNLNKILKAQETKMSAAFWEKEKTLIGEYENKMKDLREEFAKRMGEVHIEHDTKLKALNYRKAEVYKELLDDKNKEIKRLEDENKGLLKTLKRHKDAYELYRNSRNKIYELALDMGDASERVILTAARMDSFFGRIKNIAEIHMKKSADIDAQIEELMYTDEPTHNETHLKLIERKVEKAQTK